MEKLKVIFSKFKSKKILISTVVILVVILGISILFITNGNLGSILGIIPNQNEERQKVINKIDKLIELPKNETPILATVSDETKLSSDTFYQDARNGDKILIFESSKMVVLYRPSTNKIIKVGTVTVVGESQPKGTASAKPVGQTVGGTPISPTPTTTALLKVVIYNATKTPGLAKSTGDSLESKYQNIEVTGTANATGDYTKALVVDLSGKNKSAAQTLAKELGGEVGSLPSGEAKPDADILVILGSE